MTSPEYGEAEPIIMPESERAEAERTGSDALPSNVDWSALDLSGGSDAPAGGDNPGSIADLAAGIAHGAQGMPTAEDMAATNASNAEARAKAIADGLDEGTANIMYPEFSTPEDMLRIN